MFETPRIRESRDGKQIGVSGIRGEEIGSDCIMEKDFFWKKKTLSLESKNVA